MIFLKLNIKIFIFPNKEGSQLPGNYHQKVLMKSQLKNQLSGQLTTAHQMQTGLFTPDQPGNLEGDHASLTNKFDLIVGVSASPQSAASMTISQTLR